MSRLSESLERMNCVVSDEIQGCWLKRGLRPTSAGPLILSTRRYPTATLQCGSRAESSLSDYELNSTSEFCERQRFSTI